jgi:hypothetical protein
MYLYNKTVARLSNNCCLEKVTSITYSECMLVALVIHHKTRMRHIMISMASPVLPYFTTLSHKWYEFRKQLLNIKYVLICSKTFV